MGYDSLRKEYLNLVQAVEGQDFDGRGRKPLRRHKVAWDFSTNPDRAILQQVIDRNISIEKFLEVYPHTGLLMSSILHAAEALLANGKESEARQIYDFYALDLVRWT